MKKAGIGLSRGIAMIRGRRFAIVLAVLAFARAALGQGTEAEPVYRWAKGLGDDTVTRPGGLAVDGLGSVYVAGDFQGPQLSIGGTSLTNGAVSQGFVLKIDRAGEFVWARSASVSYGIGVYGVELDADTNVWLTGGFISTNGLLGATNVMFSEHGGVFVAKLDRDGTTQWVSQAGGPSEQDFGYLLALDGTGHGYVYGVMESTNATFGQTTLTNRFVPSNDTFLTKISPDGTFLWARLVDVPELTYYAGMAADGDGHVYITGSISTNQNEHIAVAKYAPNGDLVWVIRDEDGPRSPSYDNTGLGIEVDPAGNLFVAGRFTSDRIQIGTFTLTNTPGFQGSFWRKSFVMKCDPQGNVLWVRQSGGNADEQAIGIATDDLGHCYVTGGFSSTTMTLAGLTVTNAYGMESDWVQEDSFVAKFNGDGDILWLRCAGGLGYRVAVDDVGNVLLTGLYGPDESTFDDFILPGPGGEYYNSTFVAKLETTTPPHLFLRSTPEGLLLSWSALLDDFYLESTTNLNAASLWTSNAVPSVLVDNERTVTIPPSNVRQFYRLRR